MTINIISGGRNTTTVDKNTVVTACLFYFLLMDFKHLTWIQKTQIDLQKNTLNIHSQYISQTLKNTSPTYYVILLKKLMMKKISIFMTAACRLSVVTFLFFPSAAAYSLCFTDHPVSL